MFKAYKVMNCDIKSFEKCALMHFKSLSELEGKSRDKKLSNDIINVLDVLETNNSSGFY